jgi:3-deoxy-D-arabino-heptulosonate 7-phosphate (DAHP) synthase class II
MEEIDGHSLPSYRGDIINGDAFTEEARVPDPHRLISVSSACLCARCIALCYSLVNVVSF